MINQVNGLKKFKDGVTKGKMHDRFVDNEILDINNVNIFIDALYQGYDDAKRTFKNIGKHWDKVGLTTKATFFKTVALKIQELFQNATQDFDKWHHETCELFCEELKNSGYSDVTYGHAQKVINMAMKYLCCLNYSGQYKGIFNCCHMPLDSFTLEWFKRITENDKNKVKLPYNITWSKLEADKYLEITKKIFEKLSGGFYLYDAKGNKISLPKEPLLAEFDIWPNIQLHMAVEDFYFAYNDITDTKEKRTFKEKPLKDKIDQIKIML